MEEKQEDGHFNASLFGDGDFHLKISLSDLPDEGCHESYRFRVDAEGWSDNFEPNHDGTVTDFEGVEDDPRAGYSTIDDFPAPWPPGEGTNPDGGATSEPFPRLTDSFRVTYKYEGDQLTATGGEDLLEKSETKMICFQNSEHVRPRECYAKLTLQRTDLTRVHAEYHIDHHFDGYHFSNGQLTDEVESHLDKKTDWASDTSSVHKILELDATISGEHCPNTDHSECNA